MGSITVSHIGICVSNLARSTRFYTEALGFKPGPRYQVGDEFAQVMELSSPLKVETVMLEKDGFTLELLEYVAPGTIVPETSRPMNQLGFSHLSLRVEDVEAVGKQVLALGGQTWPDTAFSSPEVGNILFCTDPDGTRIELMCLKG